jgi:hypothetical protein
VVRQQNTTEYPVSGYMGTTASFQRQVANEFSRALSRAQKAAAKDDPELAVGWCRYAASLAWGANPGFFYSHELEQLLAEIGREYLGTPSAQVPPVAPPRRFLHVMSSAFETGGSTPAISRWIDTCAQHAPSELHSILISMQNNAPVPACLCSAVRSTGGQIIELPSGLSWLQMAAEMRSRSWEFDIIVLHIYPNDPLPNLAYFDRPRPVLFFRHSGHAFNLGLDVAQVYAELDPVGCEMSAQFCAKEARTVMLPLPLIDEGQTPCDKKDARKKLGLPVDALIALTVGWPYKFTPMAGYNFAEVVQSLCEANSRVHIVAVGLSESKPFPGLGQSTGGRFLPVGVVEDRQILGLYYRAADIYLDAYPCGSGTAVLDAALQGLPVQRLFNPDQCILWCDYPALDSVMRGATTQDEFVAELLEWLEWPEKRRLELGSRFRNAVLQDHCGASWKSKWLDPALDTLMLSGRDSIASHPNYRREDYFGFPGLGKAWREVDWPAGMFIAGAIHSTDHIPRPIRISGVFRAIKPAFFSTSGDGMRRERLHMFGLLVASLMPNQIRNAMRWMWRAIFKNP